MSLIACSDPSLRSFSTTAVYENSHGLLSFTGGYLKFSHESFSLRFNIKHVRVQSRKKYLEIYVSQQDRKFLFATDQVDTICYQIKKFKEENPNLPNNEPEEIQENNNEAIGTENNAASIGNILKYFR